jgi:methyltransferase-like protein
VDGSKSLDELSEIMAEQIDKGVITVQADGKDMTDGEQRRSIIRQFTENALSSLAQNALLVG